MTYSPFTWFASIRDEHNSDLLAARLAIAGLKAERDKAREDAAWWKDSVRECCNHALGTDRGNPDDRTIGTPVVLAVAEAVKQRTELVAKAQDLRASLEIALRERDAALASLAEKQRAIDEAAVIASHSDPCQLTFDEIAGILRPHATKATEAKPSATVTGSGLCCTDCDPVFRKAYGLDEVAPATTPNSVAREIASVESGDIRYRVWECRVIVPADAPLPDGFDAPPRRAVIDAITSRGIDILRCASGWGHTPTDDELGVLDKEIHYPSQPATPATTPTAAGATPAADDDTRDLIARLALAVRNDAAERCNAELEAACDAIIAAARRGGGA